MYGRINVRMQVQMAMLPLIFVLPKNDLQEKRKEVWDVGWGYKWWTREKNMK